MPKLTTEQRSEAIGMLIAYASVTQVEIILVCLDFVFYKFKTKFQATGTVKDRRRSGRPRVTTGQKDRHIRTTHLRDRFKSAI